MLFNLSYNWLKDYLKITDSPEVLAKKLSLHSATVEKIHSFEQTWQKIVIGQVKEIKPHPQADKLRLVAVDIGGRAVTLVCGGSNLRLGMKVAVALVGAKVKWHGQGDLMELKSVAIRGIKSEGMICSPAEIGLETLFPAKDERELIDLSSFAAKPGTALAKALGLDDYILEAEVTSNRPDMMSVVGLAREIAALYDKKLAEYKTKEIRKLRNKEITLRVEVMEKKLCPRYQAVMIEGIQVKESPWWLKKRLWSAGIRPINNIVDITNYVMLELGQPMHAFDAKNLKSKIKDLKSVVVRRAKEGERILALDGREYQLKAGMLVIADERRPIAIAGVMGGEESAVTTKTKTIVFESANFDPVSVRRTARALNLYSDSQLRFEKGLSTESTEVALSRAIQLTLELAGGQVASQIIDVRAGKYQVKRYKISLAEMAKSIGVNIPLSRVKKILQLLGFKFVIRNSPACRRGRQFEVLVPWWRDHDIGDSHDLVEEVARMYGYHNLPGVLPDGEIKIEPPSAELTWEDKLKNLLSGAGFTEVYTYSFISRLFLEKLRFDPKRCPRVANPLSEDFEYLRPSLLPGLLSIVKENQETYGEGKIFEISRVYQPRPNDLPKEEGRVLVAVWGDAKNGKEFFALKGWWDYLAEKFGIMTQIKRVSGQELYHDGRAVQIFVDGQPFGLLVEIHPRILADFKIEKRVAILDFALSDFIKFAKEYQSFKALPLYPAATRDISFMVDERKEYAEIVKVIQGTDPLITAFELFDVYSGKNISPSKKSLAFHISYQSPDRTLTAEEVEVAHQKLIQKLERELGAEVRGSVTRNVTRNT